MQERFLYLRYYQYIVKTSQGHPAYGSPLLYGELWVGARGRIRQGFTGAPQASGTFPGTACPGRGPSTQLHLFAGEGIELTQHQDPLQTVRCPENQAFQDA